MIIKEFISQWKTRAYEYYNNAIVECRKEREEIINLHLKDDPTWNQRAIKFKETYNQIIRDLSRGYSDKDIKEHLTKIIEREAEDKEKIIRARVYKAIGNIQDAKNLYIGVNGEINGYLIGEKGKAEVRTIYAGGYNIQCLHYRVLIKTIKEKGV